MQGGVGGGADRAIWLGGKKGRKSNGGVRQIKTMAESVGPHVDG